MQRLINLIWFVGFWLTSVRMYFFPGAGEPEEAGRDNPSAHGRVREHHHKTAGTLKAPGNPTKPHISLRCDLQQSIKAAHVSMRWLSQRGNTQALRRKQRFQMEGENESTYSPFSLRAGDTTFLPRVSLTHIVVTVSVNKSPSPVQHWVDYCLFEKVYTSLSVKQRYYISVTAY